MFQTELQNDRQDKKQYAYDLRSREQKNPTYDDTCTLITLMFLLERDTHFFVNATTNILEMLQKKTFQECWKQRFWNFTNKILEYFKQC